MRTPIVTVVVGGLACFFTYSCGGSSNNYYGIAAGGEAGNSGAGDSGGSSSGSGGRAAGGRASAGEGGSGAGSAGEGGSGASAGEAGAGGSGGEGGHGGQGGQPTLEFSSDFAFGDGSPFTGAVDTPCGTLTLQTTNTEPWGESSFRDAPANTDPATVSLSFAARIAALRLSVSRFYPGERLTQLEPFPDGVTGDLLIGSAGVGTDRTDDLASGDVIWSSLDVNEVTFTIDAPDGALAVDSFTVACEQ